MEARYLVLVTLIVATSLIGCVTSTDPSEAGKLSAVEGALGTIPMIGAGDAINITTNNTTIRQFLDQKFTAPNRRSVRVALIQNSTYDLTKASVDVNESNASPFLWRPMSASAGVNESPFLWKVELLERSCSCGSRGKSVYIATALIDPMTGEVVDAKTCSISETEYGRNSCVNACH
ncbi:MAG: hypothetical protein KAU52_03490 [Methanosarcinales archaeon]|nr:hypothetical protein [Methanosarcinales archaeon]